MADLKAEPGIDANNMCEHVMAMRSEGLLASRRAGPQVFYSAKDPRVFDLLELASKVLETRAALELAGRAVDQSAQHDDRLGPRDLGVRADALDRRLEVLDIGRAQVREGVGLAGHRVRADHLGLMHERLP